MKLVCLELQLIVRFSRLIRSLKSNKNTIYSQRRTHRLSLPAIALLEIWQLSHKECLKRNILIQHLYKMEKPIRVCSKC
jgi:hypothetical protein